MTNMDESTCEEVMRLRREYADYNQAAAMRISLSTTSLARLADVCRQMNKIQDKLNAKTWDECVARALGYLDRVHEEAKDRKVGPYAFEERRITRNEINVRTVNGLN